MPHSVPAGDVFAAPLTPDRNTERVLRLLALPQQSWGSLNGIYEIIKSDVRPRQWQALAALGINERDLEAFRLAVKHSARRHLNFRLDLGAKRAASFSSMTLEAAHLFMRRMVEAWMRTRSTMAFDH